MQTILAADFSGDRFLSEGGGEKIDAGTRRSVGNIDAGSLRLGGKNEAEARGRGEKN